MPTLELEAFDIVVVPFPFTDRQSNKRRPALVISTGTFNQSQKQCVLATITSAGHSDWKADYRFSNLDVVGL
jgi:mRNA interferase MazF